MFATNRSIRRALVGSAGLSLALLCGCSGVFTASTPAVLTESPAGTMSGTIHGGQQPIYNATVRLYSMGTSGYGTGSTLLATTTTDAGGSFSFTKQANNGTSAGNTSTWACPVSAYDPQIYITSVGGNTQGTGTTSTNNAAVALMEAIGPCSALNSGTRVSINEVTTAAAVFGLAQYMNPGTTAGTETFGTSNTTQGKLGLNNAVMNLANLVHMNNGFPVGSTQYTGTGTAAGANVTATPESDKLNTIADILAACVNTTTGTSSQCADLFASARPPILASATSQPSASFTAAVDTMQAAYYMATNPGDLGTTATCTMTPSATTNIGCLYGLSSAVAPFQPTLSAQPSDWTIGITFTATGTCANGNSLIAGPNKVAVDANGNIWFVNAGGSSTVASSLVELSPLGAPLQCVGNILAAGRGVTIDPTGNVWASFSTATALSSAILEVPAGTTNTVAWTAAATPIAIASDGSGNIVYTTAANGGGFYEFAAPGTNTTPVASTNIATGFNGTTSTQISYLGADQNGRFWAATSTINLFLVAAPTTTAGTYTQAAVATGQNTYGIAIDNNNYIYTGTTCCGSGSGTGYRALEKVTPAATTGTAFTYTASPQYTAGVNGTRASAVDGAGNVWYGYELPNNTAGQYSVGEVASAGSGTTATFTSLSPNGTTPSACSTTACYTNGGYFKSDFTIVVDLAADPSGNMWVLNGGTNNTTVPTAGTSITEIVGAAVPVATPTALANHNGALATKP